MPQVPYQPYPTEKPIEGTGARSVSVGTPSIGAEAFGAQVGNALSGLGNVAEHAGDELFARASAMQQLYNENAAKDAAAKYDIQSGLMHAKYNALEGQDAINAFPGHIKALNDLRVQIRSTLPNEMAAHMYDSAALGMMGRTVFNAAGHSADQQKQWTRRTDAAEIDLLGQSVEKDPGNEKLFGETLEKARATIGRTAATYGAQPGDAIYDDMVAKGVSKIYSHKISGTSYKNPDVALRMLNEAEAKGVLIPDDKDRLERMIGNDSRATGSSNIARETLAELPDGSLATVEERAIEKARKLFPDDSRAADAAVKATRGLYFQQKQAVVDGERDNIHKLQGLITTMGVRTEDELLVNPRAREIYNALDPRDQGQVQSWINNYWAPRDAVAHAKNERILSGLESGDVEKFLDTRVMDLNLSPTRYAYWINQQQKAMKDPQQDPRVGQVRDWMQNSFGVQLKTLGLDRKPPASAPEDVQNRYYEYLGTLQAALEAWMEHSNGKRPSNKEFNEQIAPLVLRSHTDSGLFRGLFGTDVIPEFTTPAPDNFKDQIRPFLQQRSKDLGQPWSEPHDEEWRHLYVQSQYTKIFGPPAKKDQSRGGR